MSILESMRSGTDSTAMQVVLALVVVSFVFWYSQPAGDKTSVIATINGTKIMDTELSRRMRIESRRYESALGDAEMAALQERVRQSLIEDELLRQHARKLGLHVSDVEVARELLRYEIFKNEEGRFDDRVYEGWLRRNAFASRSDFEEQIRNDILRGKLRQLVFLGVTVSEPALEEAFVEQNTRVDVRYVRVRPLSFEDDVEVTDADVDAFIASSMARVQSVYDADFARRYDLPAKVTLSMIRLQIRDDGLGAAQIRPRLEALRGELEAGADFAKLAARHSEHATAALGGAMGPVEQPKLELKVVDAIAALEPGQISKIVVEDAHMSLYRLDAREPARVVPVEEVQRELATNLIRLDRAPALAAAYAESLLAAWSASGAEPAALLDEQGLVAANTGLAPIAGGQRGMFSPPTDMMAAAARAPVGGVLPEVYTSGDVMWVGQLTKREEADLGLLAEERDMVREMVLSQKRTEFYQAWVQGLVADARIR